MRMRYDPESGALYFRVREGKIEETLELPSPGAYMDVDAGGAVMGLEFLSIQEFVMFLTGFGGEVELPDRVDVGEYDGAMLRVFEGAMRRAFEGAHEGESVGDASAFFRRAFRPLTDRERAGGR